MAELPAGPFSVVMKKPVSLQQPSEVMCTEDRFRFGHLTYKGTDWQVELPYSEIETFDASRIYTGIVTGVLKDGRPLEFRLKAAGPRKELAKDKAMTAVSARIGATGSLKPAEKSDPILLMPSEPPKGFDASGLPGTLESADNAGVGEFVRRFVSITQTGGFFVSGTLSIVFARVGGTEIHHLNMEWKSDGAVMFDHSFSSDFHGPIGETAVELLGKPKIIRNKLRDPAEIENMIDSIELFVSACCRPAES